MRSKWKVLVVSAVVGASVLCAAGARAQTVTYSLGVESDLLDADFYDGKAAPGSVVVEAASGRSILNVGVNNAGTKALLWGIDLGTFQQDLFIVDIGDPSSWERLTYAAEAFEYRPIIWCADDVHALTGNGGIFDDTTNILTFGHELIPGYSIYLTSITRRATDNWVSGPQIVGQGNIRAYPVLDNGDGDPGRPYRDVTNFTVGPNDEMITPYFSNDGNSIVFGILDQSGAPDVENIYRLESVNDILDGITSPPTTLADPRIVEIRASATPNLVAVPSFSFDGSLIFTSEDYNNVFDIQDFFPSLALADFDINYSNADGTGFVQFAQAGNQGTPIPFPTGNRIQYLKAPVNPIAIHAYATTLIATNDVDVETDPIPGVGTNSTTVGGNPVTVPFILTDSVVATTTAITVADASGTVVALPIDQVINFPTGTSTPEITIFTPIDPVAPIELPDPQTQIPVIRTFSPAGTQFEPPITITITYTDAEVANIVDESSMIPYLFNTGTQQFEPLAAQFLPSVVVDTLNNTLSFQTDHFSVYGIGGKGLPATPQRPWTWMILAAGLMGTAGMLLTAKKRLARLPEK